MLGLRSRAVNPMKAEWLPVSEIDMRVTPIVRWWSWRHQSKVYGIFVTAPYLVDAWGTAQRSAANLEIQQEHPDHSSPWDSWDLFSSPVVSDLSVWLLLLRESRPSSSSRIPAKLIFLSYRCRPSSGSRRRRQLSRSYMSRMSFVILRMLLVFSDTCH